MQQRDPYSPYEFGLVIAIAFGWPMLGSVLSLVYAGTVPESAGGEAFTDSHLVGLIRFELVTFPIVATMLYARGWRAADFPFTISKGATLIGVFCYALAWLSYHVIESGLASVFSSVQSGLEAFDEYQPHHPPSLIAIYLVSVINPVFEEVIVCGYVIPALSKRFGETAAVNASVVIRGTYHLYQGVAVLPFHLAYGLMQAYLYTRLRNLWPLVVSHALLDFVALVLLI